MTYAEQEQLEEISDQVKAERRTAIGKAGSFLTVIHRAELANQMQAQQCPFSPTQIENVIDAIGRDASDDDADPVNVIRRTLASKSLLGRNRVVSTLFLDQLAPKMAEVVKAGLKQRDERIVAAGGPKRPDPPVARYF